MADIDDIRVVISSSTERLEKGVKETNRQLGRMNKRAEKANPIFNRVAVGMVAARTAMKAFSLVVNEVTTAFSRLDRTAKTADRLGIAAERLASFGIAAQLTGSNVRAVELGLQRMTRRITDAAGKTGDLDKRLRASSDQAAALAANLGKLSGTNKAIAQLGLDAKELAKQDPGEQFLQIAEAMAGIEERGKQVSIAFKLFDSEGVTLLNTLDLGRDKLEEIQELAERLNIAPSRDELAQVEKMNDNITLVQNAIDGIFNELAIGLSGGSGLRDLAILIGDFGDALGKTVRTIKLVSTEAGALDNLLGGLFDPGRALAFANQFAHFDSAQRQAAIAAKELREEQERLAEAARKAAEAQRKAARAWDQDTRNPVNILKRLQSEVDELFSAERDVDAANIFQLGTREEIARFNQLRKIRDKLAREQEAREAEAERQGSLAGLFDRIREQAESAGKTREELEIAEARLHGATEAQIAWIKEQQKSIRLAEQQAEKMADIEAFAKRLTEENTGGPLDEFREEFEKIQEAFRRGLITKAVRDKALGKLDERILAAQGGTDGATTGGIAALELGGRAAFSEIQRLIRGGDIQKSIEENTRESVEVQQELLAETRRLNTDRPRVAQVGPS